MREFLWSDYLTLNPSKVRNQVVVHFEGGRANFKYLKFHVERSSGEHLDFGLLTNPFGSSQEHKALDMFGTSKSKYPFSGSRLMDANCVEFTFDTDDFIPMRLFHRIAASADNDKICMIEAFSAYEHGGLVSYARFHTRGEQDIEILNLVPGYLDETKDDLAIFKKGYQTLFGCAPPKVLSGDDRELIAERLGLITYSTENLEKLQNFGVF